MKILALDIATHTGWCTKTAHGVWDLSAKRDESKGIRLIRLKAKVREICELEQIDLVVFERSQGRHQNAVIIQSELHGVVKLFCHENGIEYMAFSPSQIKKHATGKGNANKEAMIKACIDKYGIIPIDDNEADSIHLWDFANKEFNR
jgi:Holliday junction resolvasome RuvABC endonuclease subunit